MESHREFAGVLGGVPFPMLSDAAGEVIRLYGVSKDAGPGARRSVFVLDRDGRIVYVNTEFSASEPKHYEAVLEALRQ
jgi:peroxiredoxin